MSIVIPSKTSKEARVLVCQAFVLFARSLLSLRIARITGDGLGAVVNASWRQGARVLVDFTLTGMLSSVINSGLKYNTNSLKTLWRERLTRYVHDKYSPASPRHFLATTNPHNPPHPRAAKVPRQPFLLQGRRAAHG